MSSISDRKPAGKLKKILYFFLVCGLIAGGGYLAVNSLFPIKYADAIKKYSQENGLSPELVAALIHAESRFDRYAVSSAGATGLMQLMKPTADWCAEKMGLEDYSYDRITEPEMNIRIGCWYLSALIGQYGGNTDTALAAYNAGSGNVGKWLKDPGKSWDGNSLDDIPFPETHNYVKKINRNIMIYKWLFKLRREP